MVRLASKQEEYEVQKKEESATLMSRFIVLRRTPKEKKKEKDFPSSSDTVQAFYRIT
jgi:hypothetical protein